MALPDPKPGLVFRYDYLWSREAKLGRDQGKERPACLVATITSNPPFVVILPITHSTPQGKTVGIEIPARVRVTIGLDDAPCWVIVSEYNVDEWPNAGLAPLPGTSDAFSYGFIPPRLYTQIKEAFLKLAEQNPGSGVRR